MSNIQYTKSLPVVAEPDVLVCGTGLAGIGAAVGATRNGASVMAVDRMGFAGGFFTNIIGSANVWASPSRDRPQILFTT